MGESGEDGGDYQRRIRQKLEAALKPDMLEITDDSARHQGHAGHDPRGETHFKLTIVSEGFAGLNRVARHRLVYDTLAVEFQERIHALTIKAMTPAEYNYRLSFANK
jgi:BolA family transcriptional regulator, general stress-responsive regulator